MSSQRFWLVILIGTFVLMVGLLALSLPSVAFAQCGEPPVSSCRTCHPEALSGEWHAIHANQDLCLNCHGGNGTSAEVSIAHRGMNADPLADIYTDCHSCHPDDYTTRAQRFAGALGRTAGSCMTPTPVPAEPVSYHPVVIPPAPAVQAAHTPSAPSLIFGVTVLVFGLGLAVTLILRRL